ncbi:Uncharacterised protein [Mycobacteroides abscessus subsp. abscessus]|nr:Uncharacterised protein [Mycobacteroides abscessus subsp. abscessus]
MLGGDIFVVQFGRELLGGRDRRDRLAGELRLSAGTRHRRRPIDHRLRLCANSRRIHSDRLEQRRCDPIGLVEQSHQDVGGTYVGVTSSGRRLHGSAQRLLCLGGRGEAVHFVVPLSLRVRS